MNCTDIDLETANKAIEAARKKAQDLGISEDIAVVDRGANLKAFIRMDNAWQGSIDIAIKKARTARLFDMSTQELGKMSQPGDPLYSIDVSNDGLILFEGGMPLKDADGNIIGAIGCSGSTVKHDGACAEAAADAVRRERVSDRI